MGGLGRRSRQLPHHRDLPTRRHLLVPDIKVTTASGSDAVLAQPGALNSSGDGFSGFTVTWKQSC
jgi:hypothetical protein